jgi:hypothetical protein
MLIHWAVQILIRLVVQVNCFFNIGVDFGPDFLPILGGRLNIC